ncbi:MAG: alkaline phosphatase PhoX [Candidatus Limnocylindria bacterium]
MTPQLGRPRRSWRAIVAALALTLTLPASALGVHGHPNPATSFITVLAAGGFTVPLINSGETFDGVRFQGIPDGIGAVPGDGWVDLYVTHEESTVPFGGFADLQASSVSRVRVDTAEQEVIELEVALGPEHGFVRFCSAFMAGPEHGFPNYTFFVNEEADETIHTVPPGAVYGADPFLAPNRQAGYSVWLDTETGAFDVISRAGRHNHENTVVIPGGWKNLAILSGDDTFNAPSSQLYLYTANDAQQMMDDKGQLWAFQVTATDEGPVADPYDRFNNANDFLEITNNESGPWSGRFIHVPTDVARGVTNEAPQAALENWSNANNVFQFVRIEDLAYDPDNPRVIYFADTGTSRLAESETTGRLIRLGSGGTLSNGRIFKMVLNENDPRIVDEFSVLTDSVPVPPGGNPATGVAFVNPDNLDVGHSSLMVQEDAASANDIWQYSLAADAWTKVASVTGTGSSAESSGIISLEDIPGFEAGWWAIDVQGHQNIAAFTVPGFTWIGPPSSATGPYSKRLEEGQLLLLFIPGS